MGFTTYRYIQDANGNTRVLGPPPESAYDGLVPEPAPGPGRFTASDFVGDLDSFLGGGAGLPSRPQVPLPGLTPPSADPVAGRGFLEMADSPVPRSSYGPDPISGEGFVELPDTPLPGSSYVSEPFSGDGFAEFPTPPDPSRNRIWNRESGRVQDLAKGIADNGFTPGAGVALTPAELAGASDWMEERLNAGNTWANAPIGVAADSPDFAKVVDDESGIAFVQANNLATGDPSLDSMMAIQKADAGGPTIPPLAMLSRREGQFLFNPIHRDITPGDSVEFGQEIGTLRRSSQELVSLEEYNALGENLFGDENVAKLMEDLRDSLQEGSITLEQANQMTELLALNQMNHKNLVERADQMRDELQPGLSWFNDILTEAAIQGQYSGNRTYEEIASLPPTAFQILTTKSLNGLQAAHDKREEARQKELDALAEEALAEAGEVGARPTEYSNNSAWGYEANGMLNLRDPDIGLVSRFSYQGEDELVANFENFTKPRQFQDFFGGYLFNYSPLQPNLPLMTAGDVTKLDEGDIGIEEFANNAQLFLDQIAVAEIPDNQKAYDNFVTNGVPARQITIQVTPENMRILLLNAIESYMNNDDIYDSDYFSRFGEIVNSDFVRKGALDDIYNRTRQNISADVARQPEEVGQLFGPFGDYGRVTGERTTTLEPGQ